MGGQGCGAVIQGAAPSFLSRLGEPHGAGAVFDCTAARTALGWQPVRSRDELVRRGNQEPLKEYFAVELPRARSSILHANTRPTNNSEDKSDSTGWSTIAPASCY